MLNRRCEKLPVNYRDSLLSADGRRCFEIDLLIGSPLYWILCAKDLKLFREEFSKYLSRYGILNYSTFRGTSVKFKLSKVNSISYFNDND